MAVQTKRANASQERIPRGRTPTDAHVPEVVRSLVLLPSPASTASVILTPRPCSNFNETTCRCCYVEPARRHCAEGETEAEVGVGIVPPCMYKPRVCALSSILSDIYLLSHSMYTYTAVIFVACRIGNCKLKERMRSSSDDLSPFDLSSTHHLGPQELGSEGARDSSP